MKIGILTFHREINDGSVLQAYCLYKLLQSLFPTDEIEIIDYCPHHIRCRRRCLKVSIKYPFLKFDLSKLTKKISQDRFYRSHVKLSSPFNGPDDLKCAVKFLKTQQYDVVFVGSDTVWDTRPNSGAPPVPNIFFLPGISNIKKIAFAASMDKGGPKFVSKEVWSTLIANIDEFDYISVRDQETATYLEQGGIEKERIKYMPDPTLLYDFSDIVQPPSNFLQNFKKLAGVAVSCQKLKEEVTRQLLAKGYNVINLLGPSLKTQITPKYFWSFGERLGVYSALSFMVTDRFHGSIFTLKLSNSPVLLIEPDYFYPQKISKGRDLFARLGIEEMVWHYKRNKPIPNDLIDTFLKKSLEFDWSDKSAMLRLRDYAVRYRLIEIKKLLTC